MKVTLHGGPFDAYETEVREGDTLIRVYSETRCVLLIGTSENQRLEPAHPIARYEPREIVVEFDLPNGGYTKETVWTFVGYEK